jgi:large subunit ribosomal protein L25
VSADQELSVNLPLHFLNEASCPGVKLHGGQIAHIVNEVQVACLPAALPEYIEVDLATLDIGDSIHLSELKLPEGVRIPELELGEDHDQVVVSVIESRVREEEPEGDAPAADAAASEGENED